MNKKLVPFQLKFRQELPTVKGNIDYANFREQLDRISDILEASGIEEQFMLNAITAAETVGKTEWAIKNMVTKGAWKGLGLKACRRIQQGARQALRCAIARKLTGEAFREFTSHLADSPVLQKFCGMDELGVIRVLSKSQLQRNEAQIPEEILRKLIVLLNQVARQPDRLNFEKELSLDDLFVDSTCLMATVHFPTDWVLLRDAVRTLMKAVLLIRKAGLKNRMESPESFLNRINKYCMQMTHSRHKKEGRKERKQVLRKMKTLCSIVERHAKKHHELLTQSWMDTELSEGQKNQILKRIDNIINQLPAAKKQAHERIIGERPVSNEDKTLSLYESDIHVIVRGKAGAQVEFGNTLYMAEQQDGVIVDWKLYRDSAPNDARCLPESLERMKSMYDGATPSSMTADRGFFSKKNQLLLKTKNIKDYLCPRPVAEFKERFEAADFARHQRRRAQTEGRIGILKNNFLQTSSRCKGFENRERDVAWGVLAHNLWVLCRRPQADQRQKTLLLAA
jgi:hypothetical protein